MPSKLPAAFYEGLALRARVVALLAGVALLLPLLSAWSSSFPGPLRWVLDLAVHWQAVYAAALATSCLAWSWACRNVRVLVLLPLCVLPALTASPRLAPLATQAPSGGMLRIASANVHFSTLDAAPVLQWLSQERVDIAVLHEVSSALSSELRFQSAYPHVLVAGRDDPFGMAIVSRYPLADQLVRKARAGSTPVLEATVQHPHGAFRVVAAHPTPPLGPSYVLDRDEALRLEARHARAHPLPTVIAGDLNATVWSSAFARLESLGWKTAAPLRGTWPAFLPAPAGIGLDHILVDHRWLVHRKTLGPALNSDHRAVLTEIALRGPQDLKASAAGVAAQDSSPP